jgi:hypothetical protein
VELAQLLVVMVLAILEKLVVTVKQTVEPVHLFVIVVQGLVVVMDVIMTQALQYAIHESGQDIHVTGELAVEMM